MKRLHTYFIFVLLSAAALFSCQKQETEPYLQLKTGSYTFDCDGNERYGITVYSSGEWTASPTEDWIGIIETIEDTLFITVKPNEDGALRSGKVVFEAGNRTAEFAVDQLGKYFKGKFRYFSDIATDADMAYSRNGRYAGGFTVMDVQGNTWYYGGIIYDLWTGEEKRILENTTGEYKEFKFISDDASVYCVGRSESATTYLFIDGEEVLLPVPEGYKNPKYQACSADGSVIVGYCYDMKNGNKFTPVKWVNGEPIILEQNEKTLFGSDNGIGVMARGCSADGSVAYGSDWGSLGAIVWKGEEMTYVGALPGYNEVTSIDGKKKCSGIIKTADMNSLSPNGRYLAATYRNLEQAQCPCMIDLETMQVYDFEGNDGLGLTCTDEGILISGSPTFGGCTECYATDSECSALVKISDWFMEKYGLEMADNMMVTMVTDSFVAGYRSTIGGTGRVQMQHFYYRPE